MTLRRICLLAILCTLATLAAAAQDGGDWRAASSNSRAITGDIAISASKLFINFIAFPLAQIRRLTPAEINAVFPSEAGAIANGSIYRLSVSPSRRFLHHNTLCGSEETQWMVTSVSGRNLQIAFFSGSDLPVFTLEALEKSSDLCGIFTYGR